MKRISLEENPKQASESLENEAKKMTKKSKPKIPPLPLLFVAVILLGAVSGVALARNRSSSSTSSSQLAENPQSEDQIKPGLTFGSDAETFKDETEGILQEGGVDGEGSHHLVRPGGDSQTVYVTSSVVDLDLFVGHKIQVWGETFNAKAAGWLMDVGRIKVLELDAPLPEE